jgi:regulator of sirC expression with transglutaminase-like and TPR domain
VPSRPVSQRFRVQAEALLAGSDLGLGDAALLLANDLCDDVDEAAARTELDRLGEAARQRLEDCADDAARADALLSFLREEGFRGNELEYQDPRNSYLDAVLERRRGIPITLAIVAIEVGRRAGFALRGISFPAHFLIRTEAEPPVVLDAFHGCILSHEDCAERLRAAIGPKAIFDAAMLRAASVREILARMIGNLKNAFVQEGDWLGALDCCDRLLLIAPELAGELRDRGLLQAQLGFTVPAIEDLEHYLELVPSAPESERILEHLKTLRARNVTLH